MPFAKYDKRNGIHNLDLVDNPAIPEIIARMASERCP
jgi:hypothetical protein